MGTRPNARSLYISENHTAQDWQRLRLDLDEPDEQAWGTAAEIVKERIEGRFLRPAQALIKAEEGKASSTFGFAVLALDFLVIETIEGFREGLIDHKGQSGRLFRSFLPAWETFQDSVPVEEERTRKAAELFESGRCALHHSGSTDFLKVGISGKALEFSEDGLIRINRNAFHQGLVEESNRFIEAIKNPENSGLRLNVRTKMDEICQK